MTSEEIVALVDRCCDGQINTTELEQLEDALRRSPDHAKRIADELELAGLIAEALDRTDPADFLRGFRERLEAERSGRTFTRETVHRALREDQEQKAPARGLRVVRVSNPENASEAPYTRKPNRRRTTSGKRPGINGFRRWLLVLPAGLLFAVLFFAPARFGSSLRVTQTNPGVIMLNATSVSPVKQNQELRPGDRIEVPIGATAAFEYSDGTRFELSQGAMLIEPGTVPVYGEQATRDRRFFLESGTLRLTLGKPKSCIVYTPQCKTDCLAAGAGIPVRIAVTHNSTRVVAANAPEQPGEDAPNPGDSTIILELTNNRSGTVFELAPGEEQVISANEGMPEYRPDE